MTQQQKQIKLAEFHGYKVTDSENWRERLIVDPNGTSYRPSDPRISLSSLLPYYFSSLDTMHELEEKLSATDAKKYADTLQNMLYGSAGDLNFAILHACAEDRAEAMGITLELW